VRLRWILLSFLHLATFFDQLIFDDFHAMIIRYMNHVVGLHVDMLDNLNITQV
jgi:hypothetical protein